MGEVAEVAIKRKLLVISCSKAKRKLFNKPALEIYDGPYYKILRKSNLSKIDVMIISAKYGLIDSNYEISNYDKQMTREIAQKMGPKISNSLIEALNSGKYDEAFFELGKNYMDAVGIDLSKHENLTINVDKGEIGVRLHNLKCWLRKIEKDH